VGGAAAAAPGAGAYEDGACRGAAVTYGAPLPGTAGVAPQVVASGCPDLGETLTLDISASVPSAPGALLAGAQRAQVSVAGGTIWLVPIVGLPLAGSAALPIALPNDPLLAGTRLDFQAVYQDAGAPFGVALSAGLELAIE
jgi:hypothetical protein